MKPPMLSIVMPVLDEGERVAQAVKAAHRCTDAEVIVVDGGSTDASPDLALRAGARVVAAPRGRAAQMNAGAAAATGDVLLFLHADTRLPNEAWRDVELALVEPGVVAGCFRLRFDRPGVLLGVFGWFSRFDTDFTTFGDQAYFVRRHVFDRLGGFPVLPFMEDVAMRRRLLQQGRFVKLKAVVVTSARRFAARGVLRQQILNTILLIGFAFGVPPERLKTLYR